MSVPVLTADACRTEALGPPLMAMVLSFFPIGSAHYYGDSRTVVNLLNRAKCSRDIFLYNTCALFHDLRG